MLFKWRLESICVEHFTGVLLMHVRSSGPSFPLYIIGVVVVIISIV